MTITLPDDMREQLEAQAKAAGYTSIDEYVADLVRETTDMDIDEATRAEWLALAEEARRSPLIPDPMGFLNGLIAKYSDKE